MYVYLNIAVQGRGAAGEVVDIADDDQQLAGIIAGGIGEQVLEWSDPDHAAAAARLASGFEGGSTDVLDNLPGGSAPPERPAKRADHETWLGYARTVGAHVEDDATKAEIIAAVDALSAPESE